MSFTGPELFASLLVGSVATFLFLYGKKQTRMPHLTGGLAMMILPMAVGGAGWVLGLGATIGLGVWLSVRAGF